MLSRRLQLERLLREASQCLVVVPQLAELFGIFSLTDAELEPLVLLLEQGRIAELRLIGRQSVEWANEEGASQKYLPVRVQS